MKKQFVFFMTMFSLSLFVNITLAQEEDADPVYHLKYQGYEFKPYIDVLCTPNGRNVLRDAPEDHLHHHGLMFAIKVDGVNFWEENDPNAGKQVFGKKHSTFINKSFDAEGEERITRSLETIPLDWVDSEQNVLLHEERTILLKPEVSVNETILTWTSELTLPEGKNKAILGGNNYHGLGMRFHDSMDKNGKFFTNSDAKPAEIMGGDTKLTPCQWMAYTAKLDGQPVTVALFGSPKNPRPMLAFTMGDAGSPFAYLSATVNLFREPMEVLSGDSVTFCYGVALWDGEMTPQEVDKVYKQWAVDQSIQ